MNHKIVTTFLPLLLSLLVMPATLRAKDDISKLKETAATVWAMDMPEFDASTPIPDSIASSSPAVIIARLVDITGSIERRPTPHSVDGYSNINCNKTLTRSMVKILDATAIDHYADFEFGDRLYHDEGVRRLSVDNSFGARIIKPDGSVREVDLSQSLKVGDGKDGDKDANRRIAIPGLEVGDVIDYFYIDNIKFEERNLPVADISLYRAYPTIHFILNGRFDRLLTVEIKPRNGAPAPDKGFLGEHKEERLNTISLKLDNLSGLEKVPYNNYTRTYPEISISMLNNQSCNLFILPSARSAGLHINIPFGAVCRDIAFLTGNYKNDDNVTGRARKMVNEYTKTHPGLTPRQVTDLAWIALCYQSAIDKNLTVDDMISSLLFVDLVKKLKTYPVDNTGIAFFNSRNDKPFNEVTRWTELDYGALVADSVYSLDHVLEFMPGEWPGRFQGEQGAALTGNRLTVDEHIINPVTFKLPALKANANELNHKATATIDIDAGTITLDREVKATGAQKSYYAGFTNMHEWIAEVEELFAIPAGKRYTDNGYDPKLRTEILDEIMLEEGKLIIGTKPTRVNSYEIVDRGLMPGSKGFIMKGNCTIDGLVADAGNDKLLSVGKLFYNTIRFKGDDRQRANANIWRDSPDSYRYSLTVNIPEGFTVTPDALASLSVNVQSKVGQFVTGAKLSDDGRQVSIMMLRRINHSVLPSSMWPEILKVYEAAAAFNEAILPLSKI